MDKKTQKIDCLKCKHHSAVLTDDEKILSGCRLMGAFLEEENQSVYSDAISQISGGKESRKFIAIDSSCMLNKNQNCEYFQPANEKHISKTKKLLRLRNPFMKLVSRIISAMQKPIN